MNKASLIEKINILGPWVHGYFDLGNGIIIHDRDIIQQRRLKRYKRYFIDIIYRHYGKKHLSDKTLCDIGCNAGFFLFELHKTFGFKLSVGFEPRSTNLAKARFIARYFKLPLECYQLKRMDILEKKKRFPVFDVVLFPGVLHHIDNQLLALQNLYKMTRDMCIIDTHILPDSFNSLDLRKKLELKDIIYTGIGKNNFGVIGYKLEDNKLDGSTFHSGIVGIPTLRVLQMMLRYVGFSEIYVYRDWKQLKKEVYYGRLHRDMYAAIVIAKKSSVSISAQDEYNRITRDVQYRELSDFIPEDIISPCYQFIRKKKTLYSLPVSSRLICESQVDIVKKNNNHIQEKYVKYFSKKSYYSILQTFKYAPDHKIPFEYAKTCLIAERISEAKNVLEELIRILNLDWRVVYKSYHLLSLIAFRRGDKKSALKYNTFALQAFPFYYPATELKNKLLAKNPNNREIHQKVNYE